MSKMSVVLSMFNCHSKLLARSSYTTTPAWLLSSTGSVLSSSLLPGQLICESLTICVFLKQAKASRVLIIIWWPPNLFTQSTCAVCRAKCSQTSPFGYLSVISCSKSSRPKSYSSPVSKLFLWNLSLGSWYHHFLVHPLRGQEPLSVPPSFSSSSKPKWSQSFNDLGLLKCFLNDPPLLLNHHRNQNTHLLSAGVFP